jgi:hypothetical protein
MLSGDTPLSVFRWTPAIQLAVSPVREADSCVKW